MTFKTLLRVVASTGAAIFPPRDRRLGSASEGAAASNGRVSRRTGRLGGSAAVRQGQKRNHEEKGMGWPLGHRSSSRFRRRGDVAV